MAVLVLLLLDVLVLVAVLLPVLEPVDVLVEVLVLVGDVDAVTDSSADTDGREVEVEDGVTVAVPDALTVTDTLPEPVWEPDAVSDGRYSLPAASKRRKYSTSTQRKCSYAWTHCRLLRAAAVASALHHHIKTQPRQQRCWRAVNSIHTGSPQHATRTQPKARHLRRGMHKQENHAGHIPGHT